MGDNGIATANLRHADLVAFTCLKALAFDHRTERKDVHDLVYCLQHYEAGFDAIVGEFTEGLKGKHADTIKETIALLGQHFVDDPETEGYLKSGPVAVAKFELDDLADNREAPQEMIKAIAFLASDDSSAITGASLPVDCGLTAGNLVMARELLVEEL